MSRTLKLKHLQAGFSIVELMISLVLGLLLMTGVIQVFLSSRQTYATNEAMARQQENGRFALEFIARSARMAGYTDAIYPLDKELPIPINCLNWTNNKCKSVLAGGAPSSMLTTEAGGNASDSIGFVLQPQLIDGVRRDCTGRSVDDTDLVINHFKVMGNSLGCSSYKISGAAPKEKTFTPLVEGIDSLQILYGEDFGNDESANSYVSADRVTDWNRVRSIRIAVLANSVNPVFPAPPARNFVLLDAAPLAFNDNRARQIFTTTIQLKNND